MAKEFERTCQRCGTTWYIPKALAKERAPNAMQIAGARIGAAGSLFSSKNARKAATLEERRARVAENSRCPNCGSSSFSQRKV